MKTKQRAKWLKLRHVDDKKTPTQLDIFVLLKKQNLSNFTTKTKRDRKGNKENYRTINIPQNL